MEAAHILMGGMGLCAHEHHASFVHVIAVLVAAGYGPVRSA